MPTGALVALILVGCTDLSSVSEPPQFGALAAGGAITVTAADPSFGYQGETGKAIMVSGSGFAPGATVEWRRAGVVDPAVRVRSVEYLSSSKLRVTVDISATATRDFYDVAVTSGRKQGIGTELFEVTSAIQLTAGGVGRAINSAGVAVGTAFFATSEANVTGLGDGSGWGIDDQSSLVVGLSSATATGYRALVWRVTNLVPAPYQQLPLGLGSVDSRAFAIASSGEWIAGQERLPEPKKSGRTTPKRESLPILWRTSGSTFVRYQLPRPAGFVTANARQVNVNGWAVGSTAELRNYNDGQAVVWERTAETTWVARVIGPAFSFAAAISRDGALIVGRANDRAVYWQKNAANEWSGPYLLKGNCEEAIGLSDGNVILARFCDNGGRKRTAAVIPNLNADPIYLSGLGVRDDHGGAEGISSNGRFVTGTASAANGANVAVYWDLAFGM